MANPENIANQGFHTHPDRINRDGRPKGARNRSTIVREWLEAASKASEGNLVVDDLVKAQIVKAMDGDTNAFKELMDSCYGKLTDKSEMSVKAEINKDVTEKLSKYPTEALEKILDDAENNH